MLLTFTLHCDSPSGRTETFALCPLHGDLIQDAFMAIHFENAGRYEMANEWREQYQNR